VELRSQHLGLGRHLWRRRPRLQRPDCGPRLRQRLGPRLAGAGGRSPSVRETSCRPVRASASRDTTSRFAATSR
jgi:hypothetical protein